MSPSGEPGEKSVALGGQVQMLGWRVNVVLGMGLAFLPDASPEHSGSILKDLGKTALNLSGSFHSYRTSPELWPPFPSNYLLTHQPLGSTALQPRAHSFGPGH